ncbi:MAG: deferrochelatase/peroxidase EfeB, partial [Solirubrobacteraceae bacterium]|nr:deferrochelatase/peroxidase EfeB [Solirubrobacteraceae bacterium]
MRTSRRRFLAGGGAAAAAALVGCGDDKKQVAAAAPVVDFHGPHQAGIVTPAQDRLHFAAFDVTTSEVGELRDMLQSWTVAAARMTRGLPVGESDQLLAPPQDTGEAADLTAGRLTVTFGFGPSLFDRRFGLSGRKPAALQDLPPLPGDVLDPDRSGGDLCVQACADDPQVAFHAVRNLARLGRGTVVMRWSQLGFGRTSTTSKAQNTPRNLMGFKDGTNNILAEDTKALGDHVWVPTGSDQAWLDGGSFLVARRIRMLIESWDRTSLTEQQRVFGRQKTSGAPLGGDAE